ncbi:hypothetical protein MN116_004111 [Schistosoma mekongi]|uniref:Protein kinase domain-containing protein n=1 Tax=Schistosoma mekongi TaxID=38744 RepID=A0AAE1ZGD2_SCHME|nr:hypothetical protein MN116_004111 [Schistosoma mekongi]
MIECRSLEHAYIIFKEFNHTQRFVHPYLPRILEIHMSMDSRNLAIYVSIIRRFIDLPSVESIIHDNIGKTSVNWELIYRMFGSILTVLSSLSKEKYGSIYFHPGNIFVSGTTFYMTDIWGPNLMNYIRGTDVCVQSFEHIINLDFFNEKTTGFLPFGPPQRRLPRYIQWCAPETSNFAFSEESDVWTLGCIITILIYIKHLSKNEEILAVNQLKSTENAFHYLSSTEELETHRELFALLPRMMKNNPKERISLNDLLNNLYVQVLLKHTNPETVMKVRRCIVTLADRPFPEDDSIEAKITYLHDNFEHENCIEKAVTWFSEYIYIDNHINLPYELSLHLFRLLYLHQTNLSIVTSCLNILAYSVESEQLQCIPACQRYSCEDVNNLSHSHFKECNHLKNLCKTNNLYLVLSIMRKYFECVNVQNLGLTFFNSLISTNYSTTNLDVIHDYLQTYDRIFKKLHKIKLCYHIIELLKCSTLDMIKIGINYLWRFCIYKPIAQKAAQDGALSISLQLMKSYQFDCEIFTNAPILIVSLLNVDEVKNQITEYADLIHILLHGLIQFKNSSVTIWNICLCLQIVIHFSEYFALQFINEFKPKMNGFDVLYIIYSIHCDSTIVTEALQKPITSIMEYESYKQCKEPTGQN